MQDDGKKGNGNMEKFNCKMMLSDGSIFFGYAFGKKEKSKVCELIFNTAMFGHQNILSDRANAGKIVVFAYPTVGNYGVPKESFEIYGPCVGGAVAREYNDQPSSVYANITLGQALENFGVPGIYGVDTRELVIKLRAAKEPIYAVIAPAEADDEILKNELKSYVPENLTAAVSCENKWYYRSPNAERKVAIIDLGLESDTVTMLNKIGCEIIVFPWNSTVNDLCSVCPDGILLSGGPACPCQLDEVVETVKALKEDYPIFGIGLGMDVLALACGAKIEKLPVAHRGTNHAVKNEKIQAPNLIVNQNHGYHPTEETLKQAGFAVTYTDVVGKTVEGMAHESKQLAGTEFYPTEAILAAFFAD